MFNASKKLQFLNRLGSSKSLLYLVSLLHFLELLTEFVELKVFSFVSIPQHRKATDHRVLFHANKS